jgi:hemolysin D
MSETALRHPIVELMARYKAVFQAVWAVRHQLAGPKRLSDEAAFLPAALSLQETPSHPAPRRAAIAICALFLIALVWSIVGEIDIVAVAQGRVVVSENTKMLQPLEAGVVRRVLVKDGDSVQAGQVLVELDATNANADQASVQDQLAAAVSEERRTAALQVALRTGRVPVLPPLVAREGRARNGAVESHGASSPSGIGVQAGETGPSSRTGRARRAALACKPVTKATTRSVTGPPRSC